MKYSYLILFLLVLGGISCKTQRKANTVNNFDVQAYESFGDEFKINSLLSSSEAMAEFSDLQDGDSIRVQFKAPTKDVCKAKGCWMVVDLGENETARVSFKDYGFFVPKDTEPGTKVILDGWAHIKTTSVDDLKHLAQDAGKSQEEIDAITEPEVGYSIVADGVLMKKSES